MFTALIRICVFLEISVLILVIRYSLCVLSSLGHHKDFENLAPSLFVSQIDSSEMTEKERYSLKTNLNGNIETTNSDTTFFLSLDLCQRLHSTTISVTRSTIHHERRNGIVVLMTVVAWASNNSH